MAAIEITFNDNELRVMAYAFLKGRLAQYLNLIETSDVNIDEIREQLIGDIDEIDQRVAICEAENILNCKV